MPRRGPELSPQMRSRICELRQIGWSYTRIYNLHLEIPKSTIAYTCKKETLRINNKSILRFGTLRKLIEKQCDQIYDIVMYEDPYIKTRDLFAIIDNVVREQSLRYLLREMGRRK